MMPWGRADYNVSKAFNQTSPNNTFTLKFYGIVSPSWLVYLLATNNYIMIPKITLLGEKHLNLLWPEIIIMSDRTRKWVVNLIYQYLMVTPAMHLENCIFQKNRLIRITQAFGTFLRALNIFRSIFNTFGYVLNPTNYKCNLEDKLLPHILWDSIDTTYLNKRASKTSYPEAEGTQISSIHQRQSNRKPQEVVAGHTDDGHRKLFATTM